MAVRITGSPWLSVDWLGDLLIQPSGSVSKSIFHQIYGTPERDAGVGPPITVPESPVFLLPAIVSAGVVRILTAVLFTLIRSPIWNLDETGRVPPKTRDISSSQ